MGRSRKYEGDVAVSAPYTQLACQQDGVVPTERMYVNLTCSHCKHSWKMPEDSLGTNRASESLNHLRACEAFAATGNELPPPRARKPKPLATEATALEQLAEAQKQTKLMEQQLKMQGQQLEMQTRIRDAITESCPASDHSSDDDVGVKKLKRGIKRSKEDAATSAYANVAKAGKFSPPRDGEPCIAIGRRVYESVEVATAAAAQVPGLKGQLRDVHSGLHIAPDAPRRERDDAVTQRRDAVKSVETAGKVREVIDKATKKALLAAHPDKIGSVGEAVTQSLNVIRQEMHRLPTSH